MKISVIVPVFNSEKYIERCIESIIAQTYDDWELILIDDGSKDSSLSILQAYASKDVRIQAIHQENAGPGIARNTGIDKACGDRVVFVDSDDIIDRDYLKLLSDKDEDVVFIDVDQVDDQLNLLSKEYLSEYKDISKDDFLRKQMTGSINWGGVRKAVKLNILRDNHIRFSEHKIGEEAIYSFLVLYYAKTFSFIEYPVYKYINRPGSQSSLTLDDPWGEVVLELRKCMLTRDVYKYFGDSMNAFVSSAAIVSLDKMAGNYSYLTYRKKALERVEQYRQELDPLYDINKKSLNMKAKVMLPFLKNRMITIIYFVSSVRRLLKK